MIEGDVCGVVASRARARPKLCGNAFAGCEIAKHDESKAGEGNKRHSAVQCSIKMQLDKGHRHKARGA